MAGCPGNLWVVGWARRRYVGEGLDPSFGVAYGQQKRESVPETNALDVELRGCEMVMHWQMVVVLFSFARCIFCEGVALRAYVVTKPPPHLARFLRCTLPWCVMLGESRCQVPVASLSEQSTETSSCLRLLREMFGGLKQSFICSVCREDGG